LIASLLVCRLLPDVTEPNLNSLLLRALFFVIVAAAGGVIGTYIYWQNPWTSRQQQTPIPFPLLVLVCASGWVWVPSLLIFGASLSAGVAIVAMIGTYTLVAGLRHAAGLIDAPLQTGVSLASPRTSSLFEESLYRPPANLTGYAIALSLYGAGALLAARDDYGAAALLALAAALFAWNRTVPRERSLERRRQYLRAAFRVAMILVPAILVTAWALLDGVTLRKRAAAASDNSGPALSGVGRNRKSMVMTVAHGADGYESVILWPVPQKKQIVPPISSPYALFGTDNKQPLVIRFDGPYRYVQPPNKLPGPNVHQARGTPLEFDIHSSNSLPVTMQAHQDLFGSIPVAITSPAASLWPCCSRPAVQRGAGPSSWVNRSSQLLSRRTLLSKLLQCARRFASRFPRACRPKGSEGLPCCSCPISSTRSSLPGSPSNSLKSFLAEATATDAAACTELRYASLRHCSNSSGVVVEYALANSL
jgi:hypothetical protein